MSEDDTTGDDATYGNATDGDTTEFQRAALRLPFLEEVVTQEREPDADTASEECIERGRLKPQSRREHGFAEEYRDDRWKLSGGPITEGGFDA